MKQQPQITTSSISGLQLTSNDVMATLPVPADTDKSDLEHRFDMENKPTINVDNEPTTAMTHNDITTGDTTRPMLCRVLRPASPPAPDGRRNPSSWFRQ